MTTLTDEAARAMAELNADDDAGCYEADARAAIAVFVKWLREPSEELMDAIFAGVCDAVELTPAEILKAELRALAAHIEGEGK